MAARPVLNGLKALCASVPPHVPRTLRQSTVMTRAVAPSLTFFRPDRVQFHNTAIVKAMDQIETATHGEADRNDAAEIEQLFRPPPEPVDASSAAYLGEADSFDAKDSDDAINPRPAQPLDASNSAYLGEGDSDDAFEVNKSIEGDKHEPLEAQAAYLGEGDSNDAFEVMKEIEGDTHEPMDPAPSGLHGELGQSDETIDEHLGGSHVWSERDSTVSEADVKADRGESNVVAASNRISRGIDKLQTEVDDLKTIMGDREGVERDKFRL